MHKRFLSFVAIVGVLLPFVTSATTFRDVSNTRYSDAFAYLSERSIVSGYSDGSGRPFDLINRAEALKVVLESSEDHRSKVDWFRKHLPPLPLFLDVNQAAWYAPYIETGFQEGIITGYANRSFQPAAPLKVEEAVALLMRASGESVADAPFQVNHSIDNRSGEWFSDSISAAIARNLISSREVLRLSQNITRGQFFDMVYRMHVVKSEKLASFNRPEPIVQVPIAAVAPRPQYVQPQPRPLATSIPSYRPPPPPVSTGGGNPLVQYGSDHYFSITIPKLAIKDLIVTHPADPFSNNGILAPLKNGVGHLFSYPGAGGKVLIYGHSSGYPWDVSLYTKIFRKVNGLTRGDQVYVTYNGNLYVYEVNYAKAVPAGDMSAYGGTGEELILYTCWPPDSISQRYLVHAFPVKTIALR